MSSTPCNFHFVALVLVCTLHNTTSCEFRLLLITPPRGLWGLSKTIVKDDCQRGVQELEGAAGTAPSLNDNWPAFKPVNESKLRKDPLLYVQRRSRHEGLLVRFSAGQDQSFLLLVPSDRIRAAPRAVGSPVARRAPSSHASSKHKRKRTPKATLPSGNNTCGPVSRQSFRPLACEEQVRASQLELPQLSICLPWPLAWPAQR